MRILSVVFLFFSFTVFAGEYSAHLIELDGFENRANSLERKIRELVVEISKSKDKAHIQALTQEIVSSHEEMEKNIRRAEKAKAHIRFEHPEKGTILNTKYTRLDKNRLKSLENELGLDQILSDLRNKVEKTYQVTSETVAAGAKATPVPTPTPTPDQRIKVIK